jgi:hypothetical protein
MVPVVYRRPALTPLSRLMQIAQTVSAENRRSERWLHWFRIVTLKDATGTLGSRRVPDSP